MDERTTDPVSLIRAAGELDVREWVTGMIVGAFVRDVPGGKQASVALIVRLVWDLPVNGAVVVASSPVLPVGTAAGLLLRAALREAASEATMQILSKRLPCGSVIKVRNNEALIDKGTAAGFSGGQAILFTEGAHAITTGIVVSAEADHAMVRITRQTKSVQPGDGVWVEFSDPDIGALRAELRGMARGGPAPGVNSFSSGFESFQEGRVLTSCGPSFGADSK